MFRANQELRENEEIKEKREIKGIKVNVESQGLDFLDHQGPGANLVLKVLLVRVNRVLQAAGVFLESQVLELLDLEERKENLAASCQHLKPSLLDHQDLRGLQAHRVHLVMKEHKDSKVNQVNLVFQEVQGSQVLDSLVLRGLQDHQVTQELQERNLDTHIFLDPLDLLDLLVPLEVNHLVWASTLLTTSKVTASENTWLDLLDHPDLQENLAILDFQKMP